MHTHRLLEMDSQKLIKCLMVVYVAEFDSSVKT